MTPQQEKHLTHIKKEFSNLVDPKYRAGASEHGGNLEELPAVTLLNHAIDEAIDQVVYLISLRDKLVE